MKSILKKKAEVSKTFRDALRKTKGKSVIEDTTHVFWGRGTREAPGDNRMGVLIMELTKELFGGETSSESSGSEPQSLTNEGTTSVQKDSSAPEPATTSTTEQSIPTVYQSKQQNRYQPRNYRRTYRNNQKKQLNGITNHHYPSNNSYNPHYQLNENV